eukprot:768714-Hanusia_phi.AAC.5
MAVERAERASAGRTSEEMRERNAFNSESRDRQDFALESHAPKIHCNRVNYPELSLTQILKDETLLEIPASLEIEDVSIVEKFSHSKSWLPSLLDYENRLAREQDVQQKSNENRSQQSVEKQDKYISYLDGLSPKVFSFITVINTPDEDLEGNVGIIKSYNSEGFYAVQILERCANFFKFTTRDVSLRHYHLRCCISTPTLKLSADTWKFSQSDKEEQKLLVEKWAMNMQYCSNVIISLIQGKMSAEKNLSPHEADRHNLIAICKKLSSAMLELRQGFVKDEIELGRLSQMHTMALLTKPEYILDTLELIQKHSLLKGSSSTMAAVLPIWLQQRENSEILQGTLTMIAEILSREQSSLDVSRGQVILDPVVMEGDQGSSMNDSMQDKAAVDSNTDDEIYKAKKRIKELENLKAVQEKQLHKIKRLISEHESKFQNCVNNQCQEHITLFMMIARPFLRMLGWQRLFDVLGREQTTFLNQVAALQILSEEGARIQKSKAEKPSEYETFVVSESKKIFDYLFDTYNEVQKIQVFCSSYMCNVDPQFFAYSSGDAQDHQENNRSPYLFKMCEHIIDSIPTAHLDEIGTEHAVVSFPEKAEEWQLSWEKASNVGRGEFWIHPIRTRKSNYRISGLTPNTLYRFRFRSVSGSKSDRKKKNDMVEQSATSEHEDKDVIHWKEWSKIFLFFTSPKRCDHGRWRLNEEVAQRISTTTPIRFWHSGMRYASNISIHGLDDISAFEKVIFRQMQSLDHKPEVNVTNHLVVSSPLCLVRDNLKSRFGQGPKQISGCRQGAVRLLKNINEESTHEIYEDISRKQLEMKLAGHAACCSRLLICPDKIFAQQGCKRALSY